MCENGDSKPCVFLVGTESYGCRRCLPLFSGPKGWRGGDVCHGVYHFFAPLLQQWFRRSWNWQSEKPMTTTINTT